MRAEQGSYLVETMVALIIGAILLLGTYTTQMASYRASTNNENQILASNMAQQLIDNARNSTYGRFLTVLNGATTVTQDVPLYEAPTYQDPLYARALLRNPSLTYTTAGAASLFNGTVTQTITNLTPASTTDRMVKLDVVITWKDTSGAHTYRTSTTISEHGIHN
jgi:type II secretory pathway pseudopilin PulG